MTDLSAMELVFAVWLVAFIGLAAMAPFISPTAEAASLRRRVEELERELEEVDGPVDDWQMTELARACAALMDGKPEEAKDRLERALNDITDDWRSWA